MNPELTCAAPDCNNPIPDRTGQPDRPYEYCSPPCRPSRKNPRRPGSLSALVVEIDQDDTDGDALRPARPWTVRLRRGPKTVVIGQDLGRFSATALSRDLQQLLDPQHEGDPID